MDAHFKNFNLVSFLAISLFLLSNFPSSFCAGWKSVTEYWDLEYTGTAFINEVQNYWAATALNYPPTKYSNCGGYWIMGGYDILAGTKNQYFERTYYGLPPHNQLNLTYLVMPVDAWDGNAVDDHYEVYVDGYYQRGWRFSAFAGYTIPLCGGIWEEFPPVTAYSTFIHSGSTLTLRFINMLDQVSNDESLGIRDIKMKFLTEVVPKYSLCGRSAGTPLPNMVCPCDTVHEYMNPPNSGTCFPCHANCNTCAGPGSNQCYSCYDGWFMIGSTCYPTCNYPLYSYVSGGVTYCTTPCPGQYVWWDQTCSSTCAYSNAYGSYTLQPVTINTFAQCNYPCGATQFLYFNTSCLNSCPAPLTDVSYKVRNFCGYSCGTSQFLYWNGSCLNNCPWPLSPETQGTILPKQFCWYYCQPGEYMYWNGSCLSTCPFPLIPETQGTSLPRQFCWYPCMPWQWIYWDQTCHASCVAPLWPETRGTYLPRQFCWYPCPSETKFLFWNGTCLLECPEPLSTRYENGEWFCDYSCSSTQYLYWNGSCISTCNSPFLSKIEGNPAQKYCYYPCPADQFVYWDNSCQSTCSFPLVPIIEGTPVRKLCWYLCPTSQFLYWNGTCSGQCDPPFIQRTTNSRNFCDFPCLADQYLYWNGSCLDTCLFPFITQVQGTVLPKSFCLYPCQPNEYLYWNGTCDYLCPSPLIQETQGSSLPRKLCHYPCEPTKYLYWNSSCLENCPSPLISEIQGTSHQRLFCWYTCDLSKFLYWNGSCLDDCPSPLLPEIQLVRKFCWYPCRISQWVYWDQTCQDACPSPLWPEIQATRQFCWYPCTTNQFLYWNGTCSDQCNFPLSPRTANNQNFCDYPCKSYQYLYWNGSCLDSCPTPLSPRLEGNPIRQFCDYLCQPTESLYWDGTCLPTCDFPLFQNIEGNPSRNFCWYLCSTSDYLYWNGSCLNQCNYPLSRQLFIGRKLCQHACSGNKYLAPDRSCVDNCPSGHFENDELKYCQPCQDSLCAVCDQSLGTKCQACKDTYLLNSNQVCQDCQELNSEYISHSDESYTYQYKITVFPSSCDLDETAMRQYLLPTQDAKNQFPSFTFQVNQTEDFTGEKYFLLEIQFKRSLSSDAKLNFALGSLQTDLQVPGTPQLAQSASSGVKAAFAAVTGGTLGAALTLGATAALWSLISFQQFISYFIYLNIQLPSHLLYFLTMFDNVNLEILPNPLANLTDQLAELWDSLVDKSDPKYQLPHKFDEFNTPTLFVINAGSTFFLCMILMILPYLFDFLRKYRDLGNLKFMKNTHSGLRWNIPIRIFLESGISLAFAIFIQMRRISFGNIPYTISTVIESLAFIYLCLMINYILQSLFNFKHDDLKSIEKSIGTLFEGLLLKKEKPSGKYYYLLILFRGMLLVFVGVFLDHLPLFQTAVMALFNLLFACYVCVIIEFESRYLTWTNRIKEVLILLVELVFMTLSSQYTTEEWRNLAGWVIICMLGLTLVMELSFGFYLQILAVRDLMKRIREFCKKKKKKKAVVPVPIEETSRKILTIETEM